MSARTCAQPSLKTEGDEDRLGQVVSLRSLVRPLLASLSPSTLRGGLLPCLCFILREPFGAVLGYDGYVVVRTAFLIVRLCFLAALSSLSFLNPQWVQTSRSHRECV